MHGRVVWLALAGLLALGVSNAGAVVTRDVSIKNNLYTPQRVIALVGDTVRWRNNELPGPSRIHTVTSVAFPSSGAGAIVPGDEFTRVFGSVGSYPYHCEFHPFMQGRVSVYNLYLTGPASAVLFGKNALLSGYAEGSPVEINKIDGAANPVASVTANALTGKFTAPILAVPGQYEAVTTSPAHTSSPVRVNVKPKLAVTKRHSGRTFWITVKATPNQAGATMVLERRKGFGWKKLASHNVGAASKTVFKVITATRISVRLRLSAPVGGYAKTTSSTLTLRP
jgi:plastocyanin